MKEWLPIPTGSGEIGELIQEAEASFLDRWLKEIDRQGQGKSLTDKQREAILERDEWECVIPDCASPKWKLNVHHLVWREFGGKNQPENLATICLPHHELAHPGLHEAFVRYREGDKVAFNRYLENNKRWKYQPGNRLIDLAAGVVWERTQVWERDDLDELFPKT